MGLDLVLQTMRKKSRQSARYPVACSPLSMPGQNSRTCSGNLCSLMELVALSGGNSEYCEYSWKLCEPEGQATGIALPKHGAATGAAIRRAYPSKARVRASSSVGPLVKGSILASVILSLIFSFAREISNSSMTAVSKII